MNLNLSTKTAEIWQSFFISQKSDLYRKKSPLIKFSIYNRKRSGFIRTFYGEKVNMYKILIVEDDEKIAGILEEHLERYGYQSFRASDLRHIKDEFVNVNPHLVLLDINLPYFDGFYWCRQIRTVSNAPIIFVSARTGEMDQVMAIENGGDDYITKPFHLDIVMAKVKSALRRGYGEYASAAESDCLGVNGLLLFPSQHVVEWQGQQTELTKNEF